MANFKNLFYGLFLLAIVFLVGSFLFSSLEGIDIFSSFYYIFLSITTIGSQYVPATLRGKILTMIIVFFGMGIVLYLVISISGSLIEGNIRILFGGLRGGLVRMKKEKNHIIVCGYGKLGKYVCEMLKEKKQKYIIIEKSPEKCSELVLNGENVFQGDALDINLLRKAKIDKAVGLIATLRDDSYNLYLVMTAYDLNPNLLIGAKAEDEVAAERLHKLGAKIVVLPHVVGGKQLANSIIDSVKIVK